MGPSADCPRRCGHRVPMTLVGGTRPCVHRLKCRSLSHHVRARIVRVSSAGRSRFEKSLHGAEATDTAPSDRSGAEHIDDVNSTLLKP